MGTCGSWWGVCVGVSWENMEVGAHVWGPRKQAQVISSFVTEKKKKVSPYSKTLKLEA